MIDQSHNLKDPIEDLVQSTEAILLAYAQALLVDGGVPGDRSGASCDVM
jgi:L-rhamnose isomerase